MIFTVLVLLFLLQIPHAHLGVSGRVMNVGGGQAFRSGMNMGGTIQGLSSNLATSGNRNYVPGNPALGPRITNIVCRSNIGINISSGGLSVPIISSHIDFRVNAASGRRNVQGSMMNGLILQGSLINHSLNILLSRFMLSFMF